MSRDEIEAPSPQVPRPPGAESTSVAGVPAADGRIMSRRRRPAPRAHPVWRFGYPTAVAAAALAVALLAVRGGEAVLDTETVRTSQQVRLDWNDPGYVEFVAPTPTLLVAHIHEGDLVGLSFLARSDVEAGGIVLMSRETLVIAPGSALDDGDFLAPAYQQGGIEAVELVLERVFGFGFDEAIEVSTETLARFMQLAEPIPYLLSDDLLVAGANGAAEVAFEAGRHELTGEQAAWIYALRNPGEADVNRLERQRQLWDAWLGAIGRGENSESMTLPFPDGLWPYVRSLSAAGVVAETVPLQTVAVDPATTPFYILGEDGWSWVRRRASELVPWPQQPKGFLRPRVQLLDGVGDSAARDELLDAAARLVIDAGGVVTVMGNVDEFGVESTQLAYHRSELLSDSRTNAIAIGLGVSMIESQADSPVVDDVVDVTVSLGRDRLGS